MMENIFSCFGGGQRIHRPRLKRDRKAASNHDEGRFKSNFHDNGPKGSERENDPIQHHDTANPISYHNGEENSEREGDPAQYRKATDLPRSRRPSIESHNSRRPTRSSHDELKNIGDQLYGWLTTRKVPFDPSQTAASSLLNGVFASHDSLLQYNQRLEEKLTRRETKLRSFEVELTGAEQEVTRLVARVEAGRIGASREISRLGQIITNHENQLEYERGETERMVALHTSEVAAFVKKQKENEAQHMTLVNDLTSNQQTILEQKHFDHQQELRNLGQTHKSNLEVLEHQHRAVVQHERHKVKQAEEDMRMSVDHFQALQDDELRNRFYKLCTEVESLSRLPPAPELMQRAQALGTTVPPPDNIPRRDHKILLQGALWAIIVDSAFRTPFQVFGAYGDPFYQTWMLLFGHNPKLDWPEPDFLVEKWRYTTTDRMRRCLSSSGTQHGPNQQIQKSSKDNISWLVSQLRGLFSSTTGGGNDRDLIARLKDLLDQALMFALLISLERCRVRVFLPSTLGPRSQRETKDVKDVFPGNENEMPCGNAQFVVAPGLSKEGNSRGGKLEQRTVLSKAVVYFSLEGSEGVS